MTNFPREHYTQQIMFLRWTIPAKDANGASLSNVAQPAPRSLPAGALVLKPLSGVHVRIPFNGAGTDLLDIGYDTFFRSDGTGVSADPDAWSTDLDVSAAGRIYCDEGSADWYVDADRRGLLPTATYTDSSGAAVTSGEAEVFIAYIHDV